MEGKARIVAVEETAGEGDGKGGVKRNECDTEQP